MASKPDFVLLTVSALTGVNQSTAEYFGLAGALRLPVFVVITKADCCDIERITQVLADLKRLADGIDNVRQLVSVRTEDECVSAAFHMACGEVMPVFSVSSVTGQVGDIFNHSGYVQELFELIRNILKSIDTCTVVEKKIKIIIGYSGNFLEIL